MQPIRLKQQQHATVLHAGRSSGLGHLGYVSEAVLHKVQLTGLQTP